MSKANQSVRGYAPTSTDKKQSGAGTSRAMIWVGLCLFMAVVLVGTASASINLTGVEDAIDAFSTIMPKIGDMVIVVVPTIIVLSIVGFITGFWQNLLDMVKSMVRI